MSAETDVALWNVEAETFDETPGSYDVVLCRHVLWAMVDPAVALSRWVCLLKPQGITVLDDPVDWRPPIDDDRYMVVSANVAQVAVGGS